MLNKTSFPVLFFEFVPIPSIFFFKYLGYKIIRPFYLFFLFFFKDKTIVYLVDGMVINEAVDGMVVNKEVNGRVVEQEVFK